MSTWRLSPSCVKYHSAQRCDARPNGRHQQYDLVPAASRLLASGPTCAKLRDLLVQASDLLGQVGSIQEPRKQHPGLNLGLSPGASKA